MSAGLTATEALMALSTSPQVTQVMRKTIDRVLGEHADLMRLAQAVATHYGVNNVLGKQARDVLALVRTERQP